MIFCKSKNFLQETEETLNKHADFINYIFNVKLKRLDDLHGMPWFVSNECPEILYFSGHTGDAINLLKYIEFLCDLGFGTQIKRLYLNTCSAKKVDDTGKNKTRDQYQGIVLPSDATDKEKEMLNIYDNEKFDSLDSVSEILHNFPIDVYLCIQMSPEDEDVKMARFLPMDECGLGFSPTESELILNGHRGSLFEKLNDAFECLHNLKEIQD